MFQNFSKWTHLLNNVDLDYVRSIAIVEAIIKSPLNGRICRLIFDHKDITSTERKVSKKLQDILCHCEEDDTFHLEFAWLLQS